MHRANVRFDSIGTRDRGFAGGKASQVNTPRVVMLHVTAVDYGTHYAVVNRSGKKTSCLKVRDTGRLSRKRIASIESTIQWKWAFSRMRALQAKRCEQGERQEWEQKFNTWQHSLRLRSKYERAPRKNNRYFTDNSRPNWERAAECMVMSYYNRVMRKNRHAKDPWVLWAETCSKNQNRKERCRGM